MYRSPYSQQRLNSITWNIVRSFCVVPFQSFIKPRPRHTVVWNTQVVLKGNHPLPSKHSARLPLHRGEPRRTATLALEVVEQLRQSRKFPAASPAETVIDLLLVRRGVEMLVERDERAVAAVAKVALVLPAVETGAAGLVGGVFLGGPSEQLVGENATGVHPVNDLVNGFAVEVAGFWARSCLEVVCYSARSCMSLASSVLNINDKSYLHLPCDRMDMRCCLHRARSHGGAGAVC